MAKAKSTIEKTITVSGYFSDKHLTKEQFIDCWIKHINQLRCLSYSVKWECKIDHMTEMVKEEAASEFERMYLAQQLNQ